DGRWIELEPDADEYLKTLDFAWPGNVRHLEQLAARLTLESPEGPVGRDEVARLLGAKPRRVEMASAQAGAAHPDLAGTAVAVPEENAAGIEAGLPALLDQYERAWLEEALRRYPRLTRAELAAKLKISESGPDKKPKLHGLGG